MVCVTRTIAAAMLAVFCSASGALGSGSPLTYIVPAASGSTEGQELPELLFADGSGMPIRLSRYVGFVVVLSFWSEQCGPCLRQMPYLDRLQGQFRGRKLLVIPVLVDAGGSAAAKTFFARNHYSYLRAYADPGASMAQALGVTGLPTTFIIDRTGRLLSRTEGDRVWDSDEVVQRLNWILSRP